MAQSTYEVRITGDTKSLERAMGRATKSSTTFGTNLKRVGIAAGAGLAALGYGAKKAVEAYEESYKVGRQTQAVLKSTGEAAKVTAKEVENLATKLSLKTGIDDEAIQKGENLLLTFTRIRNEQGKNNKIFDQTTKIALDMSVAMDQDLKSSVIQVGKALNDPARGLTSLRRAGVAFTESQEEQIEKLTEAGKTMQAQKLILRELNREFAGSAAAQASPFDKAKVAMENLQESIGRYLFPVVAKAAEGLAEFIRQIETGTGAGGKLRTIIEDIGRVLGTVGSALGVAGEAVGKWVGGAIEWVKKFTATNKDYKVVIEALKNVAAAAQWAFFNVLKPAFEAAVRIAKKWLDGTLDILKGFAKVLRGVVQVISGILTLNFDKAWEGVKNIFSGAFGALKGMMKSWSAPFREAGKIVGEALGKGFSWAWDQITGIFEDGANLAIGVLNKMIDVLQLIPFIGDNIKNISPIGSHSSKSYGGTSRGGKGASGPTVGAQRGGMLFGGKPSGDSIPAMLERGEYVLNRNAVAKVGQRRLDALNFGAAPRFQEGGPVRLISGGDVWGAVKDAAGYTPPGLAFKGAKAAVGWAKGFPDVVSAIGDITGLAGKFPGWIDGSWFVNAAIDWLKGKTKAQGKGGSIANAGPLQQFNHTYPSHTLGDLGGRTRFSEALTARIAAWAGLPGKTFGQVARGESGFYPGIYGVDPGGSVGRGLWAITSGVGNDAMIARYGGPEAMFNPLVNAKVAKEIYDSAGLGAWYGTQYVTSQRGGRVGMQKGGMAKGTAGRTVAWAQNNLGVTEGSARHRRWVEQTGGVFDPWCAVFVSAAMKAAGIAPPSNPSYSGAFLGWAGGKNIGRSISSAIPGDIIVFDKGDGGITDHVGIYSGGGKYISGNMSNAVVEANVSDYGSIVGIVRPNYPGAATPSAKGGTRAQKTRKPKFTGSAGGIAAPKSAGKPGRNEFGLSSAFAAPPYGRTRGVTRDLVGPEPAAPAGEAGEDPLLAAMEADREAREAHTEAIKENTEAMKRQTQFAESAVATSAVSGMKAVADILNGMLGGSAQQSAALAGAGSIGSIGRF